MAVSIDRVCSARGCRETGEWALRWNNPRLHTPDRRKTWLACHDHREHLASFLSLRGFLRETVPADAADAVVAPEMTNPDTKPGAEDRS